MQHAGTMGTTVFRGVDVAKVNKGYESISPLSGTDLAAIDDISKFLSNCLEMIHEIVTVLNGQLRNEWEQLKHQRNVKWFGSQNSTTQLFWTARPILPDAPRCSRTGWMQNDVLLRYSESTSGAPQCFWSSRTEYKNILKSMKLSSECYKIMPLSWKNFGAAGTTTLVSKTIPGYLEPDSPGVINI